MKKRGYILIISLFLLAIIANSQLATTSLDSLLSDKQIPVNEKITILSNKIDSLQTNAPEEALLLLNTSLATLSVNYKNTTLASLLHQQGKLQKKLGNLKEALDAYEQAASAFIALKNDSMLMNLSHEMGWIFMGEGKYELARNKFLKSLALAQEAKIAEKIGVFYNDIGISYHYQKNYEQAIDNYLKAIDIRESIQHQKGLITSYNNLGVLYKLNQDTINALKYYTKGKLLAESIPDSARIVSFNINIGRIYLSPNKVALSIPYFRKAQQIATAIDHSSRLALSQYNLAEAYLIQKRYKEAIDLFETCVQQFEQLKNEKYKIGAIYALGKAYHLYGQHQKGLKYMLEAESLTQSTDIFFVDELKHISSAFAATQQSDLAYAYLLQYSARNDSIASIDIRDRISVLQTHYEAAFQAKEKQQEIVLLGQEKKYFQKILFFVIGFSILILGLSFFLAILYRNTKRLSQILTKRNQTINGQNGKLKKLNQELIIAKEVSEKAAKIKEEFLASMSHEIRTPMNAVIGMTDILIDEEPRDDQIENLKTLKFSAKNLLTLINDVLDFSKIEAGKITLEQIDFAIEDLLMNVLETFKLSKSKKNVAVVLEKDLASLKYQVKGDPTRLTQIFTNLLGNALKFTEEGHVKLIAKTTKITDQQVHVYFAVEDTGIGIPKEKFDHIFKSFTQAADNTTRLYGGTGLGLSITKNLVELHHSKIQLSSEVGVGSTFAFEIVFNLGQVIRPKTKAKIENNLSIKEGLENRSILLAEDNKINQLVAKKILSKWKVKLDIANDGEEVLEYLEKQAYDVILMDIHMPRMDGYQATKAIRALDNEKAKTPIIALTASDYSISENIRKSGMDDFLAKPFNPNELHNRICKAIAMRSQALVKA